MAPKVLIRAKEFLTQLVRRIHASVSELLSIYKLTLRSLYFPDEMSFYADSFIRLAFSVYYIPIIVVVLATTHSALERVVWVLIVPITQEMQRSPYNYSYWLTLFDGLWHIFMKMTPFAAIGASVATIGHKFMNCFSEAMVDAYTKHNGKDYPLMRARLMFIVQKRSRMLTFCGVFALLALATGLAIHSSTVSTWARSSEPLALVGAICIIITEALFVVITVVCGMWPILQAESKGAHWPTESDVSVQASPSAAFPSVSMPTTTVVVPSSPLAIPRSNSNERRRRKPMTRLARVVTYIKDDWWQNTIGFMRYIGFMMAMLYVVVLAVSRGLFYGTTCAVLILVYLNLPHLFGYTALSVASSVIRLFRPLFWVCRHPDALASVALLALPYQALLLNAIWYFRHHPITCAMLAGVNVLLLARVVDLVREYDVTQNGSVHWTNADTSELITPSLAIILEDAFEKKNKRPDIISLDMQIDIRHMAINYTDGRVVPLSRSQIIPYGAARRFLWDKDFYVFTYPRLLSLQSPGYFGGSKFRIARVVLRIVSITMLIVYTAIVCGMLMQAAFPQLRPIPVRVTAPADNSYLLFDHIVVRMYLLSQRASPEAAEAADSAALSNATMMATTLSGTYLSAIPEAAHTAFKWNNVTSRSGVDFYPSLCTRNYYGTTVWEMALLAVAPYLFNEDEFKTMLGFMNTHLKSDWVIRQRHGTSCVPGNSNHQPTGWDGFYDVYSKERDTSIIAVRGTDLFSFTDFLIDINLFFETALYQFMSNLVPGTGLLPKELVADLIRAISLPAEDDDEDDYSHHQHRTTTDKEEVNDGFSLRPRETWSELINSKNHSLRRCQQNNFGRDFFADVFNHITYVGSRPNPPKNIVLAGHSLGGAVCAIIAAQLDVKAVAFSAPGMVLSRKKFGVDLRSIHKNVMTVVSSSDIVPLIGEQGGEVQHVECLARTRELCHAMEFLIGSLWRSCSSLRDHFPSIRDVV